MFTRVYLRASTEEQDALRAKRDLEEFARSKGLTIAATYVENESGASLKRPELFRLLQDCQPGDIILTEQVDRLSRLNAGDWERLKIEILARQIRIIALDLPTSWVSANADAESLDFRILGAINALMLDLLAAFARKDYLDRRRRQEHGIQKARSQGVYTGRKENKERNSMISMLLASGASWTSIQRSTGCSRSTLSRINKRAVGAREVENV
jgi:DNA invertase Pin-like site-specific DNA recombinase